MRRIGIFFVLVIMIVIFKLSAIPNLHFITDADLPIWLKKLVYLKVIKIGQSGFFSYTLSLHPDFILHKLGHIIIYGVLGSALFFATNQSARWSSLIVLAFACSDELHQSYVMGRSARFGDIVLDTMAAIGAILLIRRFNRKN